MLMGDVAKKAFNMITKKTAMKNIVPAISIYKLQHSEIFYGNIRVMPSYIMTGGNILIERSKAKMAADKPVYSTEEVIKSRDGNI